MSEPSNIVRNVRTKLQALRDFPNNVEPGDSSGSRIHRIFARNMRILWMLARLDVLKQLRLHAEALTYVTLLALVPLLVLLFSVVSNMGGFGDVQQKIQSLILDHLAGSPDVRTQVAEPILSLVSNIDAGHMGAISVIILIISVLSLLGHIEFAVNSIFGTTTQRPWLTRMLTYWAILTLGPILLMASFALTAAFQSSSFLEFVADLGGAQGLALSYLPFLTTWIALAVIYLVIPNTRVSLGAAASAAFVAGILWNTAKFGYASYVSHAVTLQNVYGSLAVIPLFIFWLYISWLIVLFGAQLTFAFHNSETYRYEEPGRRDSRETLEVAAVRLMLQIVLDFSAGKPTRLRQAAIEAGIPRPLLQTSLEYLINGQFIRKMETENIFVPARDPKDLNIADLINHIRQGRGHQPSFKNDALHKLVAETLNATNPANHPDLAHLSFQDLASRLTT
ncbi:MAG: YihY family inner membrane protein [Deltaproteobacteria bacterium]|jgi:membrane protein|nr:YihY family inner membrane protein [Deltaproteobacteria bacterium]MBT6431664.1 YihY family inner membrane protein [Deltaproteobacteria bacterium]